MNILITGGTGLIGRALVTKLIEDGHEVTVLTRNPEKAKTILHSGSLTKKWDGINTSDWASIIEQTDVVINLAGASIAGESLQAILTRRWTDQQKNRILQSRLNAGKALVTAIQAASKKPAVLIQASAVGFYGPHENQIIPENTPPGTDFLASVCQSWEESTAEVEEMGVRRVVIRTGLVFAPEGGILPLMLLPFRLFVGGPIGNGKQAVSWIHLDDQINAIRFTIENESAHGAYNLSAPNPVNNAEFGRIAGKKLRRPNWLPIPGFAIKLVLGEKATLVLDGQQVVPQRLLEAGYEFKYKTLETALQDLR